jgi:hypothetical protein
MTDTTTEITGELVELDELALSDFTGTVGEAIEHAVAALEPIEVGDHHLLVRVPTGYATTLLDVRASEDLPRRVAHEQLLVGVDSLARYVDQHALADTRAYITDLYGSGTRALTADVRAVEVVIDDHHAGNVPDAREHRAVLVLRPTSAARRWGQALAGRARLSQEQFLDLVVDGIGEIVTPDGARLRDLASDLHAIRTAEVQSVIRTGGQGSIQLAENVRLSAGTGDKVEFPERITISFNPFAGIPANVTLDVQVRPTVESNHVAFSLHAATLEDELAAVLGEIAAEIIERTGLTPFWTV